ncbi:unnamed protein product [Arabidopsis thaliana]|uniref:Uncharacterized protein n=1 Tax=Arabidopsis thaliana TaxID=3702 RepID=A0A654FMI2_ARATH|nr:unnamed protein product [Arabidopsis thaliana]
MEKYKATQQRGCDMAKEKRRMRRGLVAKKKKKPETKARRDGEMGSSSPERKNIERGRYDSQHNYKNIAKLSPKELLRDGFFTTTFGGRKLIRSGRNLDGSLKSYYGVLRAAETSVLHHHVAKVREELYVFRWKEELYDYHIMTKPFQLYDNQKFIDISTTFCGQLYPCENKDVLERETEAIALIAIEDNFCYTRDKFYIGTRSESVDDKLVTIKRQGDIEEGFTSEIFGDTRGASLNCSSARRWDEATPAVIKPTKPLKEGKREPEDDLETKVNLKKQKKNFENKETMEGYTSFLQMIEAKVDLLTSKVDSLTSKVDLLVSVKV